MEKIKTSVFARKFQHITRKHHISLHIEDENIVECWGTWWDGGSRSEYRYIDLNSGQMAIIPHSVNPPEFGGEIYKAVLTPERGVVVTGIFCGKPTTPSIYVLRDSMIKLFA